MDKKSIRGIAELLSIPLRFSRNRLKTKIVPPTAPKGIIERYSFNLTCGFHLKKQVENGSCTAHSHEFIFQAVQSMRGKTIHVNSVPLSAAKPFPERYTFEKQPV